MEKSIGLIKSSKKRVEALHDLDALQLAPSEMAFENVKELYKEKWKKEKEFLRYLDDMWLSTHQAWFEGVARRVPSTNNALESFNKKIKREATMRQRLTVGDFINRIKSVMNDWSSESQFAGEPDIQMCDWTNGYQWSKSQATYYCERKEDASRYIGYVSSVKKISKQAISKLEKMNWKNLEEYTASFTLHKIELPKGNWEEGSCSCGYNLKRYVCKHIIGMALRKQLTTAPVEAKSVKLGMKRGAGRPKKNSHCLNISS